MTIEVPPRPIDLSGPIGPDVPLGYATQVVREQVDGQTIYVASHPALPHCFSQGDSPEEAIDSLAQVREAFLADMAAAGVSVPPPVRAPETTIVEGVEILEVRQERPKGRVPLSIEWRRVR